MATKPNPLSNLQASENTPFWQPGKSPAAKAAMEIIARDLSCSKTREIIFRGTLWKWKGHICFRNNGRFILLHSREEGTWFLDNQNVLHLHWGGEHQETAFWQNGKYIGKEITLIPVPPGELLDRMHEDLSFKNPSIHSTHVLPRIGMMRLWQDRETIIPALLGTCPIFDKIAITFHQGANDDGCVDLVRNFLKEGKNGNCQVELHYYPYPVYFVSHPWYKSNWFKGHPSSFSCFSDFAFRQSITGYEGKHYIWIKLDTDTVYISEALEREIQMAEFCFSRQYATKIPLLYHDTVPYQGKLWWTLNNHICGLCRDHCLYNPLILLDGFRIEQGNDEGFKIKIHPDARDIFTSLSTHVCGFQFRKQIWTGGPLKRPVSRQLITPLKQDVKDDFERFMRPLLHDGNSFYAHLEMS